VGSSKVEVLTSKRCGMEGSKKVSGVPQWEQKVRSRSAKWRSLGGAVSQTRVPVGKKVQTTKGAPLARRQSAQWQAVV
jgi:hypothetical protein